jgi:hypothetical protein
MTKASDKIEIDQKDASRAISIICHCFMLHEAGEIELSEEAKQCLDAAHKVLRDGYSAWLDKRVEYESRAYYVAEDGRFVRERFKTVPPPRVGAGSPWVEGDRLRLENLPNGSLQYVAVNRQEDAGAVS